MVLKKISATIDKKEKENYKEKLSKEDHTKKALLVTIAIFFGALVFFWIASGAIKVFRGPMMWIVMSDLILFRFIFSLLIILFSLVLIFIYTRNYFEIKNDLTFVLILTVSSMMFFGMTTNPLFIVFFPMVSVWFIQTISIFFTFIALAGLLWISLK
ncbi:MAG: hypothetical protein QXV64_02555 [Candidatus Anstonellaceae archaeon]